MQTFKSKNILPPIRPSSPPQQISAGLLTSFHIAYKFFCHGFWFAKHQKHKPKVIIASFLTTDCERVLIRDYQY
jgi:hypothetical protein